MFNITSWTKANWNNVITGDSFTDAATYPTITIQTKKETWHNISRNMIIIHLHSGQFPKQAGH